MLYAKYETFSNHHVLPIIEALLEAPEDYLVYAKHVDSIYPIVAVTADYTFEEVIGFASEETYGKKPSKTYTTKHLLEELLTSMEQFRFGIDTNAYLEAASNTDSNSDMQLCEPCEIKGYGIDDSCHLFFLIAGCCWDYC